MASTSGLSSAELSRKAKAQKRAKGKFAPEGRPAPTADIGQTAPTESSFEDAHQSTTDTDAGELAAQKPQERSFTLNVPKFAVSEIMARTADLNARMEKKNLSGRVSVEWGDTYFPEQGPPEIECRVMEVGEWKVGEWAIVGIYSFGAGEDTPLRHRFPDDYEHPETVDRLQCDHCNKKRYRATCFVLADEDGDQKIVGKTCLKDFTGHNPNQVLRFHEEMEDLREWLGGGSYSLDTIPTEEYLAVAVAVTREHGFRKTTEDESTKDRIRDLLLGLYGKEVSKVTDADRETAAEIMRWADEMDARSEFDENMKIVGRSEAINARSHGIAAYMPTAYARHRANKAAQEKKKAERTPIPDNLEGPIRGTVTKVAEHEDWGGAKWRYDGQPRYVWKVTVVSDEGYTVWGTLPASADNAEPGDRVEFVVSSVEKSKDDETFGFFKRPRKWKKLEDEPDQESSPE